MVKEMRGSEHGMLRAFHVCLVAVTPTIPTTRSEVRFEILLDGDSECQQRSENPPESGQTA